MNNGALGTDEQSHVVVRAGGSLASGVHVSPDADIHAVLPGEVAQLPHDRMPGMGDVGNGVLGQDDEGRSNRVLDRLPGQVDELTVLEVLPLNAGDGNGPGGCVRGRLSNQGRDHPATDQQTQWNP